MGGCVGSGRGRIQRTKYTSRELRSYLPQDFKREVKVNTYSITIKKNTHHRDEKKHRLESTCAIIQYEPSFSLIFSLSSHIPNAIAIGRGQPACVRLY